MNYFNNDLSLVDLSKNSYSSDGFRQFSNIYLKGALTAGLLDIRIIELSKGKKGLIDVVKELTEIYGPDRPFDEELFFDKVVALTYPEIQDFIDDYLIIDLVPEQSVIFVILYQYLMMNLLPKK